MPENLPVDPPVSKPALILLGEDDIDDQELLKEIFTSIDKGLGFIPISNGKKLITYLEQRPADELPALIILDYNMPELNGAEILKILSTHKRYHSIPKIVWSTSKSNDFRAICLEYGAIDYIVKPSSITALIEVAKHMLSYITPRN